MAKVNFSIKTILTRISVLFIFLLNMEATLVNTALAEIAKAFPEADPTTISLIANIAYVFSITIALLVLPQLVKIFNKRNIILAALCIYIFGGLGTAFFNDTIAHLLIFRAILGVGMGLTAPLCAAIINELYSGLDKNNMIGWANAVDSIMGIILTMIAGYFCSINWKYTFFAYAFFIIIIVMEYFFLPSMPVPTVKDSSGIERKAKIVYTSKQYLKLFFVTAYAMIFLMFMMTSGIKLAIFISDQKLGDPVVIAGAMSFLGGGILIASFVFGIVEKFIKRYNIVLPAIISAIGAYMIYNASSPSMLMASTFTFGFGNGLFLPAVTVRILAIGPAINGTFANSMLVGIMGLGQFLSTYVEKFIGIFVEPTAKNLIGAVSLAFIVIGVISLIYVIWNPFRGVNYNAGLEESRNMA